MSPEELKAFIEGLRKDGLTDEDLVDIFLKMYLDGELDLEDLETCLNGVGYAMNEEIKKVLQENPESIGLKKKEEDNKSDSNEKEDKEEKSDSNENKDEDDKEWKEANKYFRFKD